MAPTAEQVTTALAAVEDPEIRKPITELGMVKSVTVSPDGDVDVEVWLTVAGCPLREEIVRRVTTAVSPLPGVRGVEVRLDVMADEQRRALSASLKGGRPEREVPFAQPGSLTKV